MTQADKLRVLVFAKAPQPGHAKTRLVPLLGESGAAALHARLIERTLAVAVAAGVSAVELHGAPADDDFLRDCAARYGVPLIDQVGIDLGARMFNALRVALERARDVILVGSDCAVLECEHLNNAAAALRTHDSVFAPAEDGGYVLIGARKVSQRLFEHMRWSTAGVMNVTRRRLAGLGWSSCELDTLWDIDDPADYTRALASGILSFAPHPAEARTDHIG